MNRFFLLLLLSVSFFAKAQNSSYSITNASPASGALSQFYTVSISIEASPKTSGASVTLNSETLTIAPGATQQFLFTVPQGYALQQNTLIVRVNTGSCDAMNFSASSERVRGNAAGCNGIYHITEWKMIDTLHFSVEAKLVAGGL